MQAFINLSKIMLKLHQNISEEATKILIFFTVSHKFPTEENT